MVNEKEITIGTRPKHRESTLCRYTNSGDEIKEGDILGIGDNYPCVVLYNPFEGKFQALEFGYMQKEGYLYREHELRSYTCKWAVIGNIDDDPELIEGGIPDGFDYVEGIKKYY